MGTFETLHLYSETMQKSETILYSAVMLTNNGVMLEAHSLNQMLQIYLLKRFIMIYGYESVYHGKPRISNHTSLTSTMCVV